MRRTVPAAMRWCVSGAPGEALDATDLRDEETPKPEPTAGAAPLLPRRPAPRVPAIKKPTLRRTGKVRTGGISLLRLSRSDDLLDKNPGSAEPVSLYTFMSPGHSPIREENAWQVLSPSCPCHIRALAEQKKLEFLSATGIAWRCSTATMS